MSLVITPKDCSISVKKAIQQLAYKLSTIANPTFAQLILSKTCASAVGLNVLRVTGLQTDDVALTGTLRGAYIDVSNGALDATGTIRALELKARTEAPGDVGNDVAVLEGLSISVDSKAHSVTTMRAAEFILDGKIGGTIDEAVGLRIANNLQADKATISYGLQIYRDSFDYTADIQLSSGGLIGGLTGDLRILDNGNIGFGLIPSQSLSIAGETGVKRLDIYVSDSGSGEDNAAKFETQAGTFLFRNITSANVNSQVIIRGNGTGYGIFEIYDQDDAEYLQFLCVNGVGTIRTAGANPAGLYIQDQGEGDIQCFNFSSSGRTRSLYIHGFRSGDSVKRYVGISVGTEANDTISFSGNASNYRFGGNLVIPNTGYIGSVSDPNAIQIAANGEVTFTDVATGVLPTTGAHLATKEYVDLAIGASSDYFLSDNDDSSIANYHILYETNTGEASSTLTTSPMSQNDDQLMFSYITASGVPGVTFLRAGIYILHTHLSRGTGDKPTTFYWTLSKYTTGDVETVLLTSEESTEIPNSEITFRTHAILASDTAIGATDRLVLKIYANVGAAGGNSEVTIHMEGTHDCHLTNLLPSSIWQAQGDMLDAINALGDIADNEVLIGTGAGTLAYESGATARTSLGLAIGSDVQAHDAELDSLAALSYVAASFVKMTGANTFALRTIGETADDLEATIDHDNLDNGGAHNYAYISGNDGATGITAAELEELSDGSETTLHSHGKHEYVDRGDPSADDWTTATFTRNDAWHSLDCSSIVSAGAVAIHFTGFFHHSTAAQIFVLFRKNGNSYGESAGNVSRTYNQVAHITQAIDVIVACDGGRVIEYFASTGIDLMYLTVRGWWI